MCGLTAMILQSRLSCPGLLVSGPVASKSLGIDSLDIKAWWKVSLKAPRRTLKTAESWSRRWQAGQGGGTGRLEIPTHDLLRLSARAEKS